MPPFVRAVCCFFSAWLEAAGCLLTHTSYLQGSLECEALHTLLGFFGVFFLDDARHLIPTSIIWTNKAKTEGWCRDQFHHSCYFLFLCKYQGGGGGWGRSHRSKFIKSTNNCTCVKLPVNMFSNLCNWTFFFGVGLKAELLQVSSSFYLFVIWPWKLCHEINKFVL